MRAATTAITRPLERGILWQPRQDAYHLVAALLASSRVAPPVCIAQQALAAIEAHLDGAVARRQCGLLTGALCRCPRTESRYVLVDGAVACAEPEDDEHAATLLSGALAAQQLRSSPAGRAAVGIYRSGASLPPAISGLDVELLRTLLPHPWQLLLLVEPAAGERDGAVVRLEPIHARAYASPFVELVATPRGRRAADPPRTVLSWRGYFTQEPVARMTAAERDALVARPTAPSPPLMARVRDFVEGVLRRAGDAARRAPARRAAPVAGPAGARALDARTVDLAPFVVASPSASRPAAEPAREPAAEPAAVDTGGADPRHVYPTTALPHALDPSGDAAGPPLAAASSVDLSRATAGDAPDRAEMVATSRDVAPWPGVAHAPSSSDTPPADAAAVPSSPLADGPDGDGPLREPGAEPPPADPSPFPAWMQRALAGSARPQPRDDNVPRATSDRPPLRVPDGAWAVTTAPDPSPSATTTPSSASESRAVEAQQRALKALSRTSRRMELSLALAMLAALLALALWLV